MKDFKSHFWYTKSQRNGILFLLGLIITLQFVYHFVDFNNEELFDANQLEIHAFQNQIDSLKEVELENRKPKRYPFNPNYINDYRGYRLGMSIQEIDRLLRYRKKGLFVNSPQEFQNITKVSDSLLNAISPYFKFPAWVAQTDERSKRKSENSFKNEVGRKISTTDINLATQNDFLSVDGVSESLSIRIIKYRTKIQGFSISDQLSEVWGMNSKTKEKVLQTFSILSKPNIKKININTASFKEVLSVPYIDYDLCVKIFEFRDEVAELQSISELKNIEGFPLEKYDRIVLYLLAK